MNPHKQYDLEDRLIHFAVMILNYVETLPDTKAGKYFEGQLIRSGTSPALNYGEVQGSASKRDFIFKMRIVLKELRESQVALKINTMKSMGDLAQLEQLTDEASQLVAIFTKSINTALSK